VAGKLLDATSATTAATEAPGMKTRAAQKEASPRPHPFQLLGFARASLGQKMGFYLVAHYWPSTLALGLGTAPVPDPTFSALYNFEIISKLWN
jgi:hypothetical protein